MIVDPKLGRDSNSFAIALAAFKHRKMFLASAWAICRVLTPKQTFPQKDFGLLRNMKIDFSIFLTTSCRGMLFSKRTQMFRSLSFDANMAGTFQTKRFFALDLGLIFG